MTGGNNVSIDLIEPKTDEDFFAVGRLLLTRSTCLKTQTAALIVQNGKIISYGYNMCCPQDQLYGLPVSTCPRMDAVTGTAYELCKPIHAEIVATLNAFGINHVDRKSLWHFPGFTLKLAGYKDFFRGKATLYLLGHYWACTECVEFLRYVGITEIKFDDLSGGKTLKNYARDGLAGTESGCVASGTLLTGIVSVKLSPDANVEALCLRQGLRLPLNQVGTDEQAIFFLAVPPDHEDEWVTRLGNDPAVKEAHTIMLH